MSKRKLTLQTRIEQKAKKTRSNKKQRYIEEIKKEYENAKDKYFKKTFEELDQETKTENLQELWDAPGFKQAYFRNNDINSPTSYAIHVIAGKVAFPGGYDKQKHMKQFALKNWDIQIDFNERGEVIMPSFFLRKQEKLISEALFF